MARKKVTDPDIYSKIMKTFQNATKLSIIFLLSENRKMTVTQMSKQVKVTKANLYHFVSEMVNDGLLLRPEIKVKENYVEKYYELNETAFKLADPYEAQRRLRKAAPEQYRALLQSYLASIGLYFRLFAEEVARADNAKIESISSAFKQNKILLHYSVISDSAYDYEIREYKKTIKKSIRKWGKESGLEGRNRLILIGLPRFGTA